MIDPLDVTREFAKIHFQCPSQGHRNPLASAAVAFSRSTMPKWWRFRLPGSGVIDSKGFFTALADAGYTGGTPMCANSCRPGAQKLAAGGSTRITFAGYRTDIDKYYKAVIEGERPTLPKQSMPGRLTEIIQLLASSSMPGRSSAASFLLYSAGDFRMKLASIIETQLADNQKLGRARPVSIYDEMPFMLFCWSPFAPRQATYALEYVQTVMAANSETNRDLLELEYTQRMAF